MAALAADRECWNPQVETLPGERLPDLQLPRLREQLAYVYAATPFYARKFDAAGFDPSPVGEHQAVALREVIRVHSSSGTTGRPSYVGVTRADAAGWTETISRVYWC